MNLVNARHVKNVPGRKTDVSDCQWIQRLHTYGLLSGSFRPDDQMCVLRSYWRHRENLVRYAAAHIQHMQKALTEMNIQLHRVMADINGVTGMRIIRAILEGERDREKLALMRAHGVKSTPEAIAKALEGDYREEHLFALRQAVELYDFYHRQIEACDREIERHLHTFTTKVDLVQNPLPRSKRKGKKPIKNQSFVDLRTELYRVSGVDFTQIPGLEALTVQKIVSEVGSRPRKVPHRKALRVVARALSQQPHHRGKDQKHQNEKDRKPGSSRLPYGSPVACQQYLGPRRVLPAHPCPPRCTPGDHRHRA